MQQCGKPNKLSLDPLGKVAVSQNTEVVMYVIMLKGVWGNREFSYGRRLGHLRWENFSWLGVEDGSVAKEENFFWIGEGRRCEGKRDIFVGWVGRRRG